LGVSRLHILAMQDYLSNHIKDYLRCTKDISEFRKLGPQLDIQKMFCSFFHRYTKEGENAKGKLAAKELIMHCINSSNCWEIVSQLQF